MLNKRGQIGETMTWFVATIAIVIILGISLFLTIKLSENRGFKDVGNTDFLAESSLFAYFSTENSEGITIYEQLAQEGDFNDFNGDLAKNIFLDYYEKDYPSRVWLGFDSVTNDYFGQIPYQGYIVDNVLRTINFDSGKSFKLILMKEYGAKK